MELWAISYVENEIQVVISVVVGCAAFETLGSFPRASLSMLRNIQGELCTEQILGLNIEARPEPIEAELHPMYRTSNMRQAQVCIRRNTLFYFYQEKPI